MLMRGASLTELSGVLRHRSILRDPARLACLGVLATLYFMPDPSFTATLLLVAALQVGPVVMAARGMSEGWSRRWGSRVHGSILTSSLCRDFTVVAAGSVAGAMLLVRHFNGVNVIGPLATLGTAILLLPDARACRLLLSSDPVEATRQLNTGFVLRDPTLLTTLAASIVVCLLDRTSLGYLLISMAFLQLNGLLVFVDKHLLELESDRGGWAGLFLSREGRRFFLLLTPLALVPVRVVLGDRAAWFQALAVASVILLPALVQTLLWMSRRMADMFRVTPPPPPQTYVVLPKA
jgi:hypothetical protein